MWGGLTDISVGPFFEKSGRGFGVQTENKQKDV